MSNENPTVWLAEMHPRQIQIGYLITEPGRLDRLIAFIAADGHDDNTISLAHRIADDPRRAQLENCIDLRPYGKLTSIAPMPTFVYGLLYTPLDEEGDEIIEGWQAELEAFPYCRFRLQEMQESERMPTPAVPGENGWAPELKPPRLHFELAKAPVARVLHIAASDGAIVSGRRTVESHGYSVDLAIPIGTSKRETLKRLAEIRQHVAKEWDRLICLPVKADISVQEIGKRPRRQTATTTK